MSKVIKTIKMEHVAGKKRGPPSSKRGGGSYLRSFNTAKPTSDEIMNLYPHIEAGTYIWTEDCPSYNKPIVVL